MTDEERTAIWNLAVGFEIAANGDGTVTADMVQAATGIVVPGVFRRKDGVTMRTKDWAGLCTWVVETYTSRPVRSPTRGKAFARKYYGMLASQSLYRVATEAAHAAEGTLPQPLTQQPTPPPIDEEQHIIAPPKPRTKSVVNNFVRRLSAAVNKVVPTNTRGKDWRMWPKPVISAVCWAAAVNPADITPDVWDAVQTSLNKA